MQENHNQQEAVTWNEFMQDPRMSLAHKMKFASLIIDMAKDPESALAARVNSTTGEEQQMFLQYLKGLISDRITLVLLDICKTGGDVMQILDESKRTPDQQQAWLESNAFDERRRADAFSESNYMQAVRALDAAESIFDKVKQNAAGGNSIKRTFLLYYFITRNIAPDEAGSFTPAGKKAMIALYKRFEAFIVEYFDNTERAEAARDGEWMAALEAFISAENPAADAQGIIEHLSSVLPEKYVMPNNKLANTLTRGIINVGEITLEESRRGAKKLIETTCILTYEGDNVHLSGRQPFTEYDRNVYNAVSSLYVYGDQSHVVTPAMVYRAMTGLTDSEKPTAGQLAAVTRSLDKMRFIRARIDCTAELQARRVTLNSQQINGGEIDTYLLTADAIKVKAGGQTVKAYHIIKTPILYEYAAAVKQVLTLPASMLDVKELDSSGAITTRSLSNTEPRILIKGYLIRRIEGMKGNNGLNNPVIALYDYRKNGDTHQGLYSIAGKPEADRKEMQRIREDAEKMLAYWRATGYIKSFETQTERKKITGYKITV